MSSDYIPRSKEDIELDKRIAARRLQQQIARRNQYRERLRLEKERKREEGRKRNAFFMSLPANKALWTDEQKAMVADRGRS